jgi:hypothetical protein
MASAGGQFAAIFAACPASIDQAMDFSQPRQLPRNLASPSSRVLKDYPDLTHFSSAAAPAWGELIINVAGISYAAPIPLRGPSRSAPERPRSHAFIWLPLPRTGEGGGEGQKRG